MAAVMGKDELTAAAAAPGFPANVLNVSHHNYVAGGSDRMFMELGDLLEQKGHRVIPFCSRDERNEDSEFAQYFPQTVDTGNPTLRQLGRFVYSRSARASIIELLNHENIDLAHLHIYYGKLTASILAPLRERGIPVVQTLHEYKLACPVYTLTSAGRPCEACAGGRFWKALPRLCNRGSLPRTGLSVLESYVSRWLGAEQSIDHFIGISHFVTKKMIELGLPSERITTVHNFIDTDQYEPDYTPGSYVVYFGRMESVKGVYSLLEAFAEMPDVKLLMAGTGSEEAGMQSWIEARELRNVELLGFIGGDALHDLIRGSVCTVVPSEWNEPFGLTVLESLALGKPVVATDMGGIPEVISPAEDGLLVRPWRPAELRAAIDSLVRNPVRAAEMGRAGRARIEAVFGRDRYYEKLREVYAKARARSAGAPGGL